MNNRTYLKKIYKKPIARVVVIDSETEILSVSGNIEKWSLDQDTSDSDVWTDGGGKSRSMNNIWGNNSSNMWENDK